MRPQFLLILFVVTASLIGAMFYLRQRGASATAGSTMAQIASVAPAKLESRSSRPHGGFVPIPLLIAETMPPAPDQAAIDAEIERLQKLSLSDDPNALPPILAALTSPAREIRDAAVEAAREFGSADAIPALKAAADQAQDLEEKIAMFEAADFLSLPEVSLESQPVPRTPEQLQAEALRRAQRHSPNHAAPVAPVH